MYIENGIVMTFGQSCRGRLIRSMVQSVSHAITARKGIIVAGAKKCQAFLLTLGHWNFEK